MKQIEEAERLVNIIRAGGTDTANEEILTLAVLQLCAALRELTGTEQ